mmetsp:Transcript_2428/g.6382  ORF Transcript_2428/g.6382 Transcript_2428/m.6382 type:complete len:91 (-) Transcript_2428:31-303(-)
MVGDKASSDSVLVFDRFSVLFEAHLATALDLGAVHATALGIKYWSCDGDPPLLIPSLFHLRFFGSRDIGDTFGGMRAREIARKGHNPKSL